MESVIGSFKTAKVRTKSFCFLFMALLLTALASSPIQAEPSLLERSRELFRPIPSEAPKIENNPANPAKLKLGRMLYFEPRLSSSHLISCNTCHNVGLAGADLQETSVGHAWQKGARNAPTVFNAIFNIAQFWDGRAETLAQQAKGPIQASVEMNSSPDQAVATIKALPRYVELLQRAFPGQSDPVTFDNIVKSIEVFEATLLTPGSPFDLYLKGNKEAMTRRQKKGLKAFIDTKCATCHQGVNLGGNEYHPFGVVEVPFNPSGPLRPEDDTGRFRVTFDPDDMFVFRSPPLRNVALTPPYFHSGKVWGLDKAVAIMGTAQLGKELNSDEIALITAFLRALTGKQPRLDYPVLPPHNEDLSPPHLKPSEVEDRKSY